MPSIAKFAIVRYIPDLAKGECVNIGIVWQYDRESGVRLRDEWEKVKAIDPDANVELISSAARAILSLIEATGKLDDSLAREFRSSVQFSSVTPIPLGDQPAKEVLDIIFQRLVEAKGEPPDLSGPTYQTLRQIVHNLKISDAIERRDIEGAKKAFEGIPTDLGQLESYLGVLGASKNEEDWEQAYEIMTTRGVRNARLYGLISYRWWSVGKMDLAIKIGEEGLKIAETIGPAGSVGKFKNSLAYYYADSGKTEYRARALQLAQEAAKQRSNEPAVLDTLGYVQIVFANSREDIQRGLDLCERAWKTGGPLKFYAKHVGAAWEKMKLLGS